MAEIYKATQSSNLRYASIDADGKLVLSDSKSPTSRGIGNMSLEEMGKTIKDMLSTGPVASFSGESRDQGSFEYTQKSGLYHVDKVDSKGNIIKMTRGKETDPDRQAGRRISEQQAGRFGQSPCESQ